MCFQRALAAFKSSSSSKPVSTEKPKSNTTSTPSSVTSPSPPTMATTVLITGASRGIGRGLTENYLARPNHTVIAAVRNPADGTVASLKSVTPASGSKLLVVKIDSASETDPAAAVEELKAQGVTSLDIVIANAGMQGPFAQLHAAEVKDLREMMVVNTYGPFLLYKAVFPLLKAAADGGAKKAPVFMGVSTNAASIQNLESNIPYMLGAYGAGKAALNYIVRRISFEQTWLNAFVMNPGFVQSDMGNAGAKFFGMEKAFQTIEDAVGGITSKIDGGSLETTSGNFYEWDGTPMAF